jgi:tetratricopeptide (TPR) repeat protein
MAGSRLDLGTAATFRGRAHRLLGEVEDAAEQAARALQLLGPSEHIERVSALLLLGDVGAVQHDEELLGESYREAARVLSCLRPSRRTARLWRELGDAWRSCGRSERALDAYDRALRLLRLGPRPASQPVEALRSPSSSYAPAR